MELRIGRMDFLLVLAGIVLITHPIEAQNCTAEGLQFQDLPQHNFSRLDGDAGSLEPLYNMVNLYLDAVQPNDFPTDIIQNALNNPNYINENVQEVVRYQAGYLVSFIIGVLFFIFMPLVGFIFCCCRCCGKCGGEVKERRKSTDCHRNTLAIFLLMTTIIILAGVACAFTANQRVTGAMEPSLAAFREMLADVNAYITNILGAKTKLLAQFSVPKVKVFSDLDRVSGTLGFTVMDALGPIVSPVLAMVSARIADVETVKAHLMNISAANVSLAQAQSQLAAELSTVKAEIISTLINPNCVGCGSAVGQANNLQADFTFSLTPDVQVAFNKVMSLSSASLTNSVQQANQNFNDIPGRVTSQTSQIFTDLKRVINDIERNLNSNLKVQFPDTLQNVDTFVNSPEIAEVSAQVKQYDYYRWVVSIVLCCIILLIIACNAMGLGLGTAGIATREDAYGSNACSQSGANFLMAGVGFSFIFSPLLILLVFVTFYVGGNARTLGCKPWESGEIYQVIDELAGQNLVYDLSNFFNSSVSYSSLYRHCEEGKSLLPLLPNSQIADLEKFLDVNTYSGDIIQNINQLNVDLSSVVLLDSASRRELMAFESNIIEVASYTSLIGTENLQNLTDNLLSLAVGLDTLAQNPSNLAIAAALTGHAASLRLINGTSLEVVRQNLARLNGTFQDLAAFAPIVQSRINNTIQNIDVAQAQIIPTTRNLIKNVSECLTTRQLEYFRQYLQWVRAMIMDNLFSCQPAVILIDNIRVISCDNIIDPWNAFWFCLGWCTLFLIPSIIFAVKTAKQYRTIQNEIGSPALSEMMQFKFPRVENSHGLTLPSGATAPTH
ncbi:prominin-2 [Amblyraja radiata]|uniref:prominin-2 n=1 Tax=Amblyraja radiata TaxID=386614 RepID=UPI001402EED7|nr:prominin-2 [Amblyraja radiata]